MYTQSTSKGGEIMSELRETVLRVVQNLPERDLTSLLEFANRLSERESPETGYLSEKMQAYYALEDSRIRIQSYLPDDFDPDAELAMARDEKYGCTT